MLPIFSAYHTIYCHFRHAPHTAPLDSFTITFERSMRQPYLLRFRQEGRASIAWITALRLLYAAYRMYIQRAAGYFREHSSPLRRRVAVALLEERREPLQSLRFLDSDYAERYLRRRWWPCCRQGASAPRRVKLTRHSAVIRLRYFTPFSLGRPYFGEAR